MSNASPMVSIIIPVYNAIEFLEETLRTVCAQTYENLEILLIDDGSTDGSGELCDRVREKDGAARIKVFHIKNGGVAAARNFALSRITGEYVMFVDSDDLVKTDYVQKMVEAALETGSSLVTCRHFNGQWHTLEEFDSYETADVPEYSVIDLERYRWTGKHAHSTVWAALFSRSLIENLTFPDDLYVGEDTVFFAQALKNAKEVACVNEVSYYYRFHTKSIVHSSFMIKQASEVLAWERIATLFADQSKDFRNECELAIAQRCRKVYAKALLSENPDEALLRELQLKVLKRRKNIFRSSEITQKEKLHFVAFMFFPKAYIKYLSIKRPGKLKAL